MKLIKGGGDQLIGWTPLHHACYKGVKEIIHEIILRGGSVNFTNADGNTPLHLACSRSHVDCVEYLLSCKSIALHNLNKYIPPPSPPLSSSIQSLPFYLPLHPIGTVYPLSTSLSKRKMQILLKNYFLLDLI